MHKTRPVNLFLYNFKLLKNFLFEIWEKKFLLKHEMNFSDRISLEIICSPHDWDANWNLHKLTISDS